jgi:hypothetical protein
MPLSVVGERLSARRWSTRSPHTPADDPIILTCDGENLRFGAIKVFASETSE